MLSHSAVLREYSSQTVEQQHSFLLDSPVLALYDPFGVDVPLIFDIINQSTVLDQVSQNTCTVLPH